MARIAGVDLPNKHVNIALTYIYGIGRPSAEINCEKAKIEPMRMMNDLADNVKKLGDMLEGMQKPRKVVRDEAGKIAMIGDRKVIRDANGQITEF